MKCLKLFKSDENNDSIIYFYCHARTVAYANLDILKSYLKLTSPGSSPDAKRART